MFRSRKETKRFKLGDLVYDEFFGRGIVIDLDERFDEMQVSFHAKVRETVWLTTNSVKLLEVVSKVIDQPLYRNRR
jgi:hypothetical protein